MLLVNVCERDAAKIDTHSGLLGRGSFGSCRGAFLSRSGLGGLSSGGSGLMKNHQ